MTFLKTLGKLLLVLLFAIAAFAWYYKNSIEPVYNGQLKLKGLSEQVTVFLMILACRTLQPTTKQMLTPL
jgi:hypothetical protein